MRIIGCFVVAHSQDVFLKQNSVRDPASVFQAKWRPDLGEAVADAAIEVNSQGAPSHCKFAVIGAGWGGAYAAWRASIDTNTIDPSDVCVFEAMGRVGGRVYSVRNLPGLGDLVIDAGGYRFSEAQLLPAQLVWDALKLPTACYDFNCSAQCETFDGKHNCHVIKDIYGNNNGYATVIETMLGKVENEGVGTQVFFGKRLSGIFAGEKNSMRLTFSDGTEVSADKVLFNIPRQAIDTLDEDSIIFTKTTEEALHDVENTTGLAAAKVYAYYEDAWWVSKIGQMQGNFNSDASEVPLRGRYHDGPVKCVIGQDPVGDPIYSREKVPFGNCSGALEAYYTFDDTYWRQFMTDNERPLTVLTEGTLIDNLHQSLMAFHDEALRKVGVDPTSLEKPKLVTVSNWILDANIAPTCNKFHGTAEELAVARKPIQDYDLYIANVDYSVEPYSTGHYCWAVGSLATVEKVMQAELGLSPPTWLDKDYNEQHVASLP